MLTCARREIHSDAQRMRGRDRNLPCLLLFIAHVYNRIITLWSCAFPCIVHLDVFVCLSAREKTLITQIICVDYTWESTWRALACNNPSIVFELHYGTCMEISLQSYFLYHAASVHPAVKGTWLIGKLRIVKDISCRKCAEFSPEEFRSYKRVTIPWV